jgi:hypothetical protein
VDGYKVGPLFAKEGGMALLYLVEDPSLPRLPLVMKVLPADSPPDMVARMEREAHALSMLSSARHVVRIHKTGRCPDGSPYIVMEKLVGEDLQKRLRREGKLDVGRAVEFGVQASMGLHACHIERVLHRDIKPGNLFLHHEAELGEVVKIIDFGISHLGMGPAITALNATSGTRRYMAPEQARGQDDERADQFSLAAVLYEMLAGKLPWPMPKKNDGGEHERFVAAGKYTPLRTLRPEVSEGLEVVVMRALSPVPDGRYASVFEFGKELLPYATAEAQAMFRKYAENVGRVRSPIAPVPVSQQVTVPRQFVDHHGMLAPSQVPGGAGPKASEAEYATVASGGRSVTKPRRRYVVALVAGGVLLAAGMWLFGGERPQPQTRAVSEPLPPNVGPARAAGADVAGAVRSGVAPLGDAGLPSGSNAYETTAETEAPSSVPQSGVTGDPPATKNPKQPSKKRSGLKRTGGLLKTPQGTAIPD